MNSLFGQVTWDRFHEEAMEEKKIFRDEFVQIEIERIHNPNRGAKNYSYDTGKGVLCAIIGYISNLKKIRKRHSLNEKNDTDIVLRLYYMKGQLLTGDLDGSFTIFLWDRHRQSGYVFQDKYGFHLPLYYFATRHEFTFSSSLKKILKAKNLIRKLDMSSVYDFLYCGSLGFAVGGVPDESTLVKNVHKLLPGQYIEIGRRSNSFEIRHQTLKDKKVVKNFAKSNLLNSIDRAVEDILTGVQCEEITTTLSSGYDSNIILYCLSRLTDEKPINAVTIGGKTKSEIPASRAIAEAYKGVHYSSRVIESDRADFLPDIVWRYEGYLCEIGIFLQYELARQLDQMRLRTVFLGDYAEQQLDQYRLSRIGKTETQVIRLIKRTILKILRGRDHSAFLAGQFKTDQFKQFKKNRDIIGVDVVKKSGIMLNSYGIQSLYPFLCEEIATLSSALGRSNRDKAFYKRQVKNVLEKKVSKHISLLKIGGSTWIEYLFTDKTKHVMRLLRSEFVKVLLTKKQIKRIANNPQKHVHFILQLIYLFLFNELFMTGKYDAEFDKPYLPVSLNDFLK